VESVEASVVPLPLEPLAVPLLLPEPLLLPLEPPLELPLTLPSSPGTAVLSSPHPAKEKPIATVVHVKHSASRTFIVFVLPNMRR